MNYNIRNIDLNLLIVLDALYEERSVTRAADRLALTQPTVSGMLKRLREIFEDDLYVRTSHGVVPTPRAEALAKPIKEFIAAAQSVLVEETFDPEVAEFHVTLCGSDYSLNTIASTFAGDILKRAPNARVTMNPQPKGSPGLVMDRGETDFLFVNNKTTKTDLPTIALYEEHLVCLSSYAAHRDGQALSIDALCDLRHVLVRQAGAPVSVAIDHVLSTRGYTRHIALYAASFESLFRTMRNTELVAFLPARLARPHSGEFKELRTDLKSPEFKCTALWHPRMANDPRHTWLRDTLARTARRMSDAEANVT